MECATANWCDLGKRIDNAWSEACYKEQLAQGLPRSSRLSFPSAGGGSAVMPHLGEGDLGKRNGRTCYKACYTHE